MTAFDTIAAELRARITRGEWTGGTRLPTERDLATSFDVARNTIRKALDALEKDGLVSRYAGRGTFVNSEARNSCDVIDDFIGKLSIVSPLDVVEARLMIEPQVAALVAGKATERDLQSIQQAFDGTVGAGTTFEFEEWDGRLHQVIFDAARNEFLSYYCRALGVIRNRPRWMQMKIKTVTGARRALYNRQHEAVVRAIRQRDPAGAAEKMQEHLRSVRDGVLPFL